MTPVRLYVNIDHVATVRQARRTGTGLRDLRQKHLIDEKEYRERRRAILADL